MARRPLSALLAALVVLAPFPAWPQVGRVSFESPVAPAPSFSAGAIGGAALAPSMTPALAPGAALALSPALASPAAPQLKVVAAAEPVLAVPVALARVVPRRASNDDHFHPLETLTLAASDPANVGRLFDAAPEAPDLETLATVKTPPAPAPWTPSSALLKPAAAAVNAWRLSRHEKRLLSRMPEDRVTTEELGIGQTLTDAHEAISTGRLQDAIKELTRLFVDRDVARWYRANPAFQPYQEQGRAYLRFIERAVKLAYERAHGRAREASLIAEARAAARSGSLLGHEWSTTAIQERDSAHCAHHALYNAISSSAGFAYPVSVARFVERARELLNVKPESLTGKTSAQLAAIHRQLGYTLGVDVGEGMGTPSIARWAQLLGLSFESRGPPRGDAQWSALLGRGREVMLSLRMFHAKFPHGPEEREMRGHDYRTLHHEVYLLGAFDSPSRGARLYMVQDSGSGATDFYTAEELSAVASEIQVLTPRGPVVLP